MDTRARRILTAACGVVALAAAAWWLYGGVLDAPFVLDDEATILGNRSLEHLWPPADFVRCV